MKILKCLVLSFILTVSAIPTYSEDGGIDVSVGLVAGYGSSEYKGVEDDWSGVSGYKGPFPIIVIDSKYFFLSGLDAGIHLFKNDMLKLDIIVGMIDGFDPDDSDDWAVKQMKERKYSMFAGIGGSIETQIGTFGASFKADVLDKSDSMLAEVSYEYPLIFKTKFMLVPSVKLTWANDKHNNYYYGVSDAESVRSGLVSYKADAGFTPSAELIASYFVTQHIALMLHGSYAILPDEVKDSPIVDRDNVWQVTGGVIYRF